MQTIDLYDRLLASVKENSPQKMDMRKMCSVIRSFPEEHRVVLYVLIKHHEHLHGSGSKTWRVNPYKGKTFEGGKGVMFNFNFFPPLLQDIIARYIEWISQTE